MVRGKNVGAAYLQTPDVQRGDTMLTQAMNAVREQLGADGATFVLRDGETCFYAAENAIAPLWKGLRFPSDSCISGWVMIQKTPTVVSDIYADHRIPLSVYEPTFVRSLAMVPIRPDAPIGALGAYWAAPRSLGSREIMTLQPIADYLAIKLEDATLLSELRKSFPA